jgi:hypothetical protein
MARLLAGISAMRTKLSLQYRRLVQLFTELQVKASLPFWQRLNKRQNMIVGVFSIGVKA